MEAYGLSLFYNCHKNPTTKQKNILGQTSRGTKKLVINCISVIVFSIFSEVSVLIYILDFAHMLHFAWWQMAEDNDSSETHISETAKQVSGNGLVFGLSANKEKHYAYE